MMRTEIFGVVAENYNDQIHSNNKYTFLNRCPLVFFKVPERVSIFHDLTVLELEYSKDTILKVIIQRYKYKYK